MERIPTTITTRMKFFANARIKSTTTTTTIIFNNLVNNYERRISKIR
jgi:hypothetical protein